MTGFCRWVRWGILRHLHFCRERNDSKRSGFLIPLLTYFLSNLLVEAKGSQLTITATELENHWVEIVSDKKKPRVRRYSFGRVLGRQSEIFLPPEQACPPTVDGVVFMPMKSPHSLLHPLGP